MIPGIEDDVEEPTQPCAPPVEATRPTVRLSLGFYHYLQECGDLVAAMSTDDRPLTRRLCLEWRIAARAIQTSFGKLNNER